MPTVTDYICYTTGMIALLLGFGNLVFLTLGDSLKVRGLLFPLLLGFLTGINLCPTFALVFTEASGMNNLLECLWFFLLFFIGTTVYFVPIPLVGLLRNREGAKTVGRFLLVLICAWFIYKGIMLIFASGGII
jgi:hypothetical protein